MVLDHARYLDSSGLKESIDRNRPWGGVPVLRADWIMECVDRDRIIGIDKGYSGLEIK